MPTHKIKFYKQWLASTDGDKIRVEKNPGFMSIAQSSPGFPGFYWSIPGNTGLNGFITQKDRF